MAKLKAAPPRGIIRLDTPAPLELVHRRYEVDAPLDESIEHWWSVAWKVAPGARHEQSSLPHPSIHVVWEGEQVQVVGVVTGRFTRVHEALLALERTDRTLAQLAAELGYADQAHFTRDFRALVGVPPSKYFALLRL